MLNLVSDRRESHAYKLAANANWVKVEDSNVRSLKYGLCVLGTKQQDRLRAPANFYYISFLGLKAFQPVHQNIKRGTKRMRLHQHSTLLWEDPGLDAARLPDLGQGRGFECGGSEKNSSGFATLTLNLGASNPKEQC